MFIRENVFRMRKLGVFFLMSIKCELVSKGIRVFVIFMGNCKIIFLVS